jgi:glycosyltransferase involved in cell wall biosynthesis
MTTNNTTRYYNKNQAKLKPLISIITVALNVKDTIESTLLSIKKQSFTDYEIIVLDGGSVDGSLEILKQHQNSLLCWISEPDKGIYDAMNKGIKMANGNWIIFMNSGDVFFDKNALEKIVKYLDGDVVYGDHAIYNHNPDKYECVSVKKRSDKHNIPFCHQSVFVRRELLQKFPFDLKYQIASDYDQYLRIKKSGAKIKHIPVIVTMFLDGGVSSKSRLVIIREYFGITKKYWPIYASFVYLARLIKYFLLGK